MKKSRKMKRRGGQNIVAAEQYRPVYLYFVQNLNTSGLDLALSECLPLLIDMLPVSTLPKIMHFVLKESVADNGAELLLHDDDLSDMLANAFQKKGRTRIAAKAQAVRYLLKEMHADEVPKPNASKNKFLRYIASQLDLTDSQQHTLYCLAVFMATNRLHWLQMQSHTVREFCQVLSAMIQVPISQLMQLVSPNSILLTTGLVQEGSDAILLSDETGKAIRGDITIDEFQQDRFVVERNHPFAIDSFDIDSTDREIMTRMLAAEGPCLLLLYGKPGSGKTELARTLVKAAGQKLLVVPPLVDGSSQSRLSRVHYTTFFADNGVILVDEADNILNTHYHFMMTRDTGTPSKSLLNTFLDQNKAKIIWITNDYRDIHESTLRRFHFKQHFEKLSLRQREQAMDLILKKHDKQALRSEKFIEATIKDEFITPGILDSVIQSFVRIEGDGTALAAEKVIPRLINSHRPEKKESNGLSAADERYHLEILNTSGKPEQLIETAKTFFGRPRKPGAGLNFLLHGLPGTGKTEFVKHLARECGRDVVFKRGSDLLSMWLGGTEQNIAEAFREAERNDAVLLVDEADTFFQPRENAVRSWEVSQTNEFLNQMENHSALLFCCTNLISKLDAASMRRFHFKLEFRAMAEARRAAFFTDYFKELIADLPPSYELQRRLSRLATLTPGDFRAVRQRMSFRPPASVEWLELVAELENEGSYKKESQGKAIGF